MARFHLNLDYPLEKMELSRRRIEARAEFRYVDRVPVLYGVFPRYFAPLFDLPYLDFFNDAETQYHWQLQFAKYRIENLPEDYCTGPTIYVHPYFANVIPPRSCRRRCSESSACRTATRCSSGSAIAFPSAHGPHVW